MNFLSLFVLIPLLMMLETDTNGSGYRFDHFVGVVCIYSR